VYKLRVSLKNIKGECKMGYNTTYTLRTYDSDKDIIEISDDASEDEFEWLKYAIDDDGEWRVISNFWHDHETDMRKLSIKYPDIVFELYGEGEIRGDIWIKYFKNGKMQSGHTKITFDKFDEKKLR